MGTNKFAGIEINALSKIYQPRSGGPVRAIDNLTLSIPGGQLFGILGGSGAGKSTLIKIIGGMTIPTSGSVRLNGYDLSQDYTDAIRQVGIVMEGTQEINQNLSIWENLMQYGRVRGCEVEKLQENAEALLRKLNLWQERDNDVHDLSRGQQRKIVFACPLIADPPILALDEPLSGLDEQAAQKVKAWLSMLAHDQGKTVVLATRHPNIAQTLCDYVAIIAQGQLITSQPVADLLKTSQQIFQIKVKGHLGSQWRDWFDNLAMDQTDEGETIISGPIVDQAALHGLIAKVRDLGLPLLSIVKTEPTLEEAFGHLTSGKQ